MPEHDMVSMILKRFAELSPQQRIAARYIVDNPTYIAIESMRGLAARIGVKPTTLLRLARALGYESYGEFRRRFQEPLRAAGPEYPGRARDLQKITNADGDVSLFDQVAASHRLNLNRTIDGIDIANMVKAAEMILSSRRCFLLGTRAAYSLAYYTYAVGRLALPNLLLISDANGVAFDGLAFATNRDTLVSIGFSPYVSSAVRATEYARSLGVGVVAITDSRASPIAVGAESLVLATTKSPQFFPSFMAGLGVIEYLLAFIVGHGNDALIKRLRTNEQLLRKLGIYWEEDRQ